MMLRYTLGFTLLALLGGCIGDDIIDDRVDEVVTIENPIDSLQVGVTYQLNASFLNNIGIEEEREIAWESADENLVTVDQEGTLEGIAVGDTYIVAHVPMSDRMVTDTMTLHISEDLEDGVSGADKGGQLRSTSSYILQGNFTVVGENGGIRITFDDTYKASEALPDLVLFLTNNPTTTAGAYEIGSVEIFSGAHSYFVPNVEVGTYEYLLYYCVPFNVKVGDGLID
ncbi:Ig-like domain-containing protein [Algivirga pacifica]|uniref:DM13 domain-containing protein n=1 Tax=Algivirga pacifica TaxID=1162670 RepID=A0ABP9D4L4_9BACT